MQADEAPLRKDKDKAHRSAAAGTRESRRSSRSTPISTQKSTASHGGGLWRDDMQLVGGARDGADAVGGDEGEGDDEGEREGDAEAQTQLL